MRWWGEGGGLQEVFFALIFLGTKSRNSCNRDGGYEWVGMKNGSVKISIMKVYERVGMKNGSIMIFIMFCFYFLFNFLYKPD